MARPTSPAESTPSRTVTPVTYRRITLAVLVTQALIVMSGAAVRLTGSGLGCSDWPRCEQDRFVPATDYNAVIEFANRVVSLPVLVAVLLAIWGASRRRPYRPELRSLSWALLGGVVVQILLGAVVVRLDLLPSTVIFHFLISMVLIALAVALHHAAGRDLPGQVGTDGPSVDAAADRPWWPGLSNTLIAPLGVLAATVLVAGTVVTASGPHGGDETAERLPVFLPTATRVHSLAAWAFLAVLVIVVVSHRRERAPESVQRAGSVLLAACLVQGGIGYVQYWNGVPAGLVFLHVVGSMAVWGTTVWLVLEHRRRAAPAGAPSAADATEVGS